MSTKGNKKVVKKKLKKENATKVSTQQTNKASQRQIKQLKSNLKAT